MQFYVFFYKNSNNFFIIKNIIIKNKIKVLIQYFNNFNLDEFF